MKQVSDGLLSPLVDFLELLRQLSLQQDLNRSLPYCGFLNVLQCNRESGCGFIA